MSIRDNEFGITELQQRFADEYLIDLNGQRAMLACRPDLSTKSAAANASKVLRKPPVQAYLNWKRAGRDKKLNVTIESVVAELAKIGFANMKHYTKKQGAELVTDFTTTDDDQMAAIQEITVETYTEGRGEDAETVKRVKFKLGDKRSALVDLGRHLGAFPRDAGPSKDDEDGPALKVVVEGGLPSDD